MEQAITPATRLVVLTNLHNPTGALDSRWRRCERSAKWRGGPARACWSMKFISRCLFDSRAAGRFLVRRNIRRDEQPDESLRFERPALRLGPGRAGVGPSHLAMNDLFAATAAHPAERISVMAFDHLDAVPRTRACAYSRPIERYSTPFSIRAPIWSVCVRLPVRWFFRVSRVANRMHSSTCCAKNTRPRLCPVRSSKRRDISGSESAARRRRCRPDWKDWERPWTNLQNDSCRTRRADGRSFWSHKN